MLFVEEKIQLFVLTCFLARQPGFWLSISRFVRDVLTFNLCTAKNQFVQDRKIGFGTVVEIINTSIFLADGEVSYFIIYTNVINIL